MVSAAGPQTNHAVRRKRRRGSSRLRRQPTVVERLRMKKEQEEEAERAKHEQASQFRARRRASSRGAGRGPLHSMLKQCADGSLPGHVEPVSGPPRAGNGPQRAAAAGPSPSIGGGGSGFRPRNRVPNRGTARWGAIRAGESMAGSLPPGTERIDLRDL